ncbi:MAG: hypothetical protein ACRDPH_03585 [Marmoricola sp.]
MTDRWYAATKRRAAERWADDNYAYTDAKGGTILDLLQAAEAWSTSGPEGES